MSIMRGAEDSDGDDDDNNDEAVSLGEVLDLRRCGDGVVMMS